MNRQVLIISLLPLALACSSIDVPAEHSTASLAPVQADIVESILTAEPSTPFRKL